MHDNEATVGSPALDNDHFRYTDFKIKRPVSLLPPFCTDKRWNMSEALINNEGEIKTEEVVKAKTKTYQRMNAIILYGKKMS